jgi:hypothetical protein
MNDGFSCSTAAEAMKDWTSKAILWSRPITTAKQMAAFL